MILDEDKEQSQNVEQKYLDPEVGIEIELKKDRLYKLRKTTKIVKPTKSPINEAGSYHFQSIFDKLDHYKSGICPDYNNFEENVFLTDDFLDDILNETYNSVGEFDE